MTIEALKGSIEKWKSIVAGEVEDRGTENCPLCQLYYRNNCYGCPIFEKTGREGCEQTPYNEWSKFFYGLPYNPNHDCYSSVKNHPGAKPLAEDMLKYLQYLLIELETQESL